MRKIILLISIILLFLNAWSSSTPAESLKPDISNSIEPTYPPFNIITAKAKDVEKFLGRKMKLKEKIGFKFLQHKLKKESYRNKGETGSEKGKLAMILGIVGIACLLIPYALLASIPLAILAIIFGNQAKKQNPDDGKAKAGVILGWVTLGLATLAIILVVAFLSSWGNWG